VHAAAQVDQAFGALNQRRKQVRCDDVNYQQFRTRENTCVVDNHIHWANGIDLFGEVAGLREV
jgi:hypothetical protein